jgi:hypothetical protein
MPPRKPTTSK